MNKPKLIDVADAAGVSKSTVSQFLNGRFEYMSTSTRARVQRVIDELNFVPNKIAQSLKTNKTKTIGVIVRDIAGDYTSQAIRGMDDYVKAQGYDLIIYNTDFNSATEVRAIKSLGELQVDGIMMISSGQNADLISAISNGETPIVQFQLEHDDSKKDIIVSDYKNAAFQATEYLINLGHQRICFISQKFEVVKSRRERYQGYVEALTHHGIPIDEQLIQYWRRDTGFQNPPEKILNTKNPPTAFFSQHLAITIDLLKSLNLANISIPQEVSVLGFDEIPMADLFKIPITVIKQQPYLVGEETGKLLLRKIQYSQQEPERVMVPCHLVERNSCRQL